MSDWASEAAAFIERIVATVRERVVLPARYTGRTIVFGTVAVLVGVALIVVAAIGIFHGMVTIANELTPGPDDNAWIAWLVLAGILLLAGTLLWGRRTPPADRSDV